MSMSVGGSESNQAMGKRQLLNDAYTVGWICAITTEYVAARTFLDEEDERPIHLSEHDNNHYTLGRIGRHNVVIAVVPDGEYGIAAAAGVARDLLHSFPNVRVGLMVGIGGGAPSSKHDIRLGDVVVGLPSNGHGGVLQYDYGKTIQNQSFKMTGHLNQPPSVLRSALSGLKARYECDGHELAETIRATLARKPRLRKKYSQPDANLDRLYHSHTTHPEDDDSSCAEVCGELGSLIPRTTRTEEDDNPMIHYGLIASANQVMKDALLRDKLSKEKGVMCFEMEAAGLMNHFPCLVIRGICDYADTHKSKEWQGYAAMTAAAFAKDLLYEVHPAKVEAEKKICDILSGMEQNIRETKENVEEIAWNNRLDKLREWLQPPDPSTNLNKAAELRHPHSGEWLLCSTAYANWKANPKSFLWLNGTPGCGKTVLSSTVIQDLQKSDQVVLYFYFDFSDETKQSLEKMIRSLLYQCYSQAVGARKILDSLYASCDDGIVQSSFDSLRETLNQMMENVGLTRIVIDALDECMKRNRSKAEDLLAWIQGLQSSSIRTHVLVTSRPEQDIHSAITEWAAEEDIIPLQSALVEPDICRYIKTRVRELGGLSRWRGHPAVQAEIESVLTEKADGMFRWVACQLDSLENCLDLPTLRKALQALPKTLDETYMRIIHNIPSEYLPHTKRILQFLAYSDRPLRVDELVDAIAVDLTDRPRFKTENRMPIPGEIKRCCSSLVVVATQEAENDQDDEDDRDGDDIVQFMQLAHFSVKEWLLSDRLDGIISRELHEISARASIAMVCLAYLIELETALTDQDEINFGPYWGESNYDRLCSSHHLLEYSTEYWAVHSRVVEERVETVRALARELFSTRKAYKASLMFQGGFKFLSQSQLSSRELGFSYKADGSSSSQLIGASHEGLACLVLHLINQGADVNAQTCLGSTPMYYAAINGHSHVVEILLQYGALNVRYRGDGWQTALQAAASRGHESIVRLLLQHGVSMDFESVIGDDLESGGALQDAAAGGHESIVRLLLDHGADANAQGGRYVTALCAAVYRGSESIVSLLLSAGAEINMHAVGINGGNALHDALVKENENLSLMLLEEGAEFKASILESVGIYGSIKVASVLLQKCADASERYRVLNSLFKGAVYAGKEKLVLMLLEAGADPDNCSFHGVDLFQYAAFHSSERVVSLLMNKSVNTQPPWDFWFSQPILENAAKNPYHSEEIMAMLFEKHRGPLIIPESVLLAAAKNRFHGREVMAMLVEKHKGPLTIPESVLLAAVEAGEHIVSFLLEDPNCETRITDLVINTAAQKADGSVLTRLVKQGGIESMITEDVIRVAAANMNIGSTAIALLLEKSSFDLQITDKIVQAAAMNALHGLELVKFLLQKQNEGVLITEDILEAAAANESGGFEILDYLLENFDKDVFITANILQVAVQNRRTGPELMHLLIQQRAKEIQITEEIIIGASYNPLCFAEALKIILEAKGRYTTFTESMVSKIASSFDRSVPRILLRETENDIPITSAIIKAAAENELDGASVMTLLLDTYGEAIEVTEDVMVATIQNRPQGRQILHVLLDRQPEASRKCITAHVCATAASHGLKDFLDLLCQYSPHGDIHSKWADIADLYNASIRGNSQRVKNLLCRGCPPDIPGKCGKTPLLQAAMNWHTDVVELLLREDIDVNRQDEFGDTALIITSRHGHDDIVNLLLEAGCQTGIKNKHGETALEIARGSGILSTVRLLEQANNV